MVTNDVCSRPPITIRFCDLHTNDIRWAMSEIASYHERDQLSPFSWFMWVVCILAFLWPSLFVSPMMVPAIILLLDLMPFSYKSIS
jgi:hypothetical protein